MLHTGKSLLLRSAVENCLTDQEKEVVCLRYGLFGQEARKQREVAALLGISRSYVSRIEKRALERLRAELEEPVNCLPGTFCVRKALSSFTFCSTSNRRARPGMP